MNKTYFTAGFSGLLGVVLGYGLLSSAGCGNKGGEEVANINGEVIDTEDIHRHLETKSSFTVVAQNGSMVSAQVFQTPAFQALLDLVTQKIVTQMAKDEKVYPTDAELMKELEFRKKVDPNYVTNRTSAGIPLQKVKENLAFELSQERIVTKGVNITDQQVEDFIKDNPQEFTTPEELDLYYIQVNTPEKRQRVDTELSIGKPFKSVAVMHSDSPTIREDNGKVNARGRTFTQQLPTEVRQHVEKTAVHKHTPWIKAGNAWMKFYVDKRTPAKKMAVDALLKEQVRRRMAVAEGSRAVDIQKRILDRLKSGNFKVSGPLEKMWERYITELKRNTAPKVDEMDSSQ